MAQIQSNRLSRRGRIFPDDKIAPEEMARRKAEREERYQKCRAIFERVQSELSKDYYNWFIIVEPN